MNFWGTRVLSIAAAIGGCFLLDSLTRGILGTYEQRLVVLAGLYVTLAVSLNLINGITGQFSIGHAAFYQVGAYVTGYLSVTYFAKGISIPAALSVFGWFSIPLPFAGVHQVGVIPWLIGMMFIGAVFAAVAGFFVGLPSLRLRGDYLAIVTLGFGEIIRIIVQNTKEVGGSYGFNVQPKQQSVWLVWLLAVVCIATCRNLLKTAHGLPFLAVREDEVAASAMGVNVTRIKVTAFIIGSAFAGAAGALLAHFEGFITPATFAMDVSFIILTMVVLGGTGSITGSAIAAIFLSYLPEYLRSLKGAGGGPLTLNGAAVVASLIGVIVAIALVKRIIDHSRADRLRRAGLYVASLIAGGVAFVVTNPLLNKIPGLAAKQVEAGQLRMVIFAITLIILMLIRPQGVFAHHEFSWSWVKKLLGKKHDETAVAA